MNDANKMEFEGIGGSGSCDMYSLYDYSESPHGETVMCIEIHRSTGNWWFVSTKSVMTKEHMKCLYDFLETKING